MNFFSGLILTICLGFSAQAYAQEAGVFSPQNAKNKIINKSDDIKSFVIGTELRQYRYTEPDISHSGFLYGIWGEWYWNSAIGKGKLYGSALYGVINYEGYSCDINGLNCVALKAPTVDFVGRINSRLEYSINKNVELFAGLGYRYLYDRGEGGSFYTRVGQWAYFPVGAKFKFDSIYEKLFFEVEYNFIFFGNMKSNVSEAISTLPDITSQQNAGSGITLSSGVKLSHEYSLSVFFESWALNTSNTVIINSQSYTEPKNESQSYGLKLGYLF